MFLRMKQELPRKRLGFGPALMVSVFALSLAGCVSSPSGSLKADSDDLVTNSTKTNGQTLRKQKPRTTQPTETATTETALPPIDSDAAAVALDSPSADMQADQATQTPADIGGLTMQSTGINASRSSIFSTRTAQPVDTTETMSDVPAYAPTSGLNPAFNSVYSRSTTPETDTQPTAETSDKVSDARNKGKKEKMAAGDKPINALAFRNNDYIGADDLPLSMAASFYASKDLYTPGDDNDDKPAGLMKLASLSGLARAAAHGLKIQNAGVKVGCFKPELVGIIKAAERHFGRKAVVTSGYRDVAHNRRVGGVEGSMHLSCNAADMQIDGVSKWDLAAFLRSQPGRGGVGTYCHTASVHIDTGRTRDWNWRCGRREA
ncbi:D-Ala-D-Ala carboxypeptidase family metallohydrolase [Rhizobium sp. LjRoot30]|uniref:YcbK family protein n=1 Tax=Rhizobium sp. LjRoot30 TaxID=3342320 RepID=UPI003ECC8F97